MSRQACKRQFISGIKLVGNKAATKLSQKDVARQEEDGGVHGVENKLQLDLDKPLRHALEQVFHHQGTVVLAFQGSSYNQVLNYAVDIRTGFKPPGVSDTKADSATYEIKVEVVEVLILEFEYYRNKLIEQFKKIKVELREQDITLVSLKTSYIAGQSVLTINTQGEPVFFKDLNPDGLLDDTSLFIKVQYQCGIGLPQKIMWINWKTLLPIRYAAKENLFFAALKETDLHPGKPINGSSDPSTSDDSKASAQTSNNDTEDNRSDPFYYIKVIYDKGAFNYHVHGGVRAAEIYPADGDRDRTISKRPDRLAVLSDDPDLKVKFDITQESNTSAVLMDPTKSES